MTRHEKLSYLKFTFFDPRAFSHEVSPQPALEIGTFVLLEPYSELIAFVDNPHQLAEHFSGRIGLTTLEHTAEKRTAQMSSQTNYETVEFFYCGICAGRLTSNHCAGCWTEYPAGSVRSLWRAQPDLPTQVALYATSTAGYGFSQ